MGRDRGVKDGEGKGREGLNWHCIVQHDNTTLHKQSHHHGSHK